MERSILIQWTVQTQALDTRHVYASVFGLHTGVKEWTRNMQIALMEPTQIWYEITLGKIKRKKLPWSTCHLSLAYCGVAICS